MISISRQIYECADLKFPDEPQQVMLVWEKNNEQGKHGEGSYSLEEFGLTTDLINRTFPEYIRQFINQWQ